MNPSWTVLVAILFAHPAVSRAAEVKFEYVGGIEETQKAARDAARRDLELRAQYQRDIAPRGHAEPVPNPYDIYSDNCHTAANRTVCSARDKSKVGILACGGDPKTSPEHHTANWLLLGNGEACIYNWGRSCCWKDTGSPPNIASGPGLACAKQACATQYCDDTRCLAAGEKVEMPGPLVCTVVAAGGKPNGIYIENPDYSPANRPACLDCCDKRTKYWDTIGWTGDREKKRLEDKQKFSEKCRKYCNGFFSAVIED